LNEKWAEFFKKYNFLVGVSIDGLKELNDRRRVTGSGAGSFDLAMDGISKLRRAGVDFNILTVIHENNVNEVSALMNFYKEYDFRFVQFLPCMNFTSQDHGRGGGEYVITPIEYGDFLCEVFDFWYNEGNPQMSIRFFDNLLSSYLHLDAEICTHQQRCPKHMIMESNGVAYPCDFFMNEKFTLGNIQVDSLQEIISRMDRHEFYNYKQNLPSKCLRCDHLKRCYGGCPRNRDVKDLDSTDYFCESYQMIYQYSSEKMSLLANNIKKQYLQDYIHKGLKLPDRNEACLCGSGMKFKKCCQHISSGC